METKIIKGEKLKNEIFANIKSEITALSKEQNQTPGIAFVGFANVPLGKYNIPFHVETARALGFKVYNEVQPEGISEAELIKTIDKLNKDKNIHAIEVLQPLPEYLNPLKVVGAVYPEKEMEGFHPANMMKTMFPDLYQDTQPMCLPTALKELFMFNNIRIEKGKEWVLILDNEFFENPLVSMVTRTAITNVVPVGSPLTILNCNNKDIAEYCRRADYLVIVTKKPESIKASWLKKGVCIIDIYSNLVKEIPSKKDPSKLIPIIRGGVNVEAVQTFASAILPIPGGLMSVVLAIMFRNILDSFKKTLYVN